MLYRDFKDAGGQLLAKLNEKFNREGFNPTNAFGAKSIKKIETEIMAYC